MRHLDTDTLAAFLAIYHYGSFTQAANQLGKTQAAVSLMLRRLEKQLGQRLLERSRHGITLSEAGEKLIGYAQRLLALEEETLAALGCLDAKTRIRIGMPDDYLGTIGAALIENFSQKYPQFQIEIVSDLSLKLEKMLDAGLLEMAILTRLPGDISGEFLRQEAQLWCTAPGCAPESRNVLPLVLFPEGCRSRPMVLAALAQARLRWRVVCSSSHLSGVQTAVRVSQAVTVLPASVIPNDWRILGPNEQLPALPALDLALKVPADAHIGTRRLAQFIRELAARPLAETPPSLMPALR
ncbi:Transcriptional regulator, LysR family (plasmid) [Sodalis praecaptivus]|uniref:Transcriptional regulator, LysR family n=1 Tax=Sodalis praecaptivus TaxID=1239307 RepID=W0HZH7_9GAMM|nr:LysR family transcriptional regulator [Sodalis praecaptivus]AHF79241.1 Transcriptional regulator, LysR family [Sodalis praecaptivus]